MNLQRFDDEPAFLADLRAGAARRALELPMPDRSTHRFRFTEAASLVPGGAITADLLGGPSPAIEAVFDVPAEATAAGVRVLPIARALASDLADRVAAHLGQVAGMDDPLLAANLAMFSAGAVVFVPDRAQVAAPVTLRFRAGAGGGLAAIRTLVLVGREASATVLEELDVPEGHAGAVTEFVLGPGAIATHGRVESGGKAGVAFSRSAYRVDRDASLSHVHLLLSGGLVKAEAAPVITGPGGRSEGLGMAFTAGRARADFRAVEDHAVGDSQSRVTWRAVAADRSRTIFTGLLRIAPGAARSEAFEEARSLLLSDRAVAETIPELEILNHDVRCTHGAAVAPLDEDAVFFLRSRGLTREDARAMLVEGFVEPVLSRLPLPELADRVRGRLREAMAAA